MSSTATIRKLAAAMLVLAILGWAEAGLALAPDQPVMQCTMSAPEMQNMGEMPCCPDDAAVAPAGSHAQCCENGDVPERPLGFVVGSEKNKAPALEVVAVIVAASTVPAASHFAGWRSADAPRFVRPVLELKTDLRI